MLKLFGINISQKVIKFIIVGFVNTIFSITIYSLLVFFGLNIWLVTLLQLALSIIFNFLTFGHIVFGNGSIHSFFKFIIVCVIQYFVFTLGVMFLTYCLIGKYISGVIMVVPVAILSYYLNNKLVFSRKYKEYNKWN